MRNENSEYEFSYDRMITHRARALLSHVDESNVSNVSDIVSRIHNDIFSITINGNAAVWNSVSMRWIALFQSFDRSSLEHALVDAECRAKKYYTQKWDPLETLGSLYNEILLSATHDECILKAIVAVLRSDLQRRSAHLLALFESLTRGQGEWTTNAVSATPNNAHHS